MTDRATPDAVRRGTKWHKPGTVQQWARQQPMQFGFLCDVPKEQRCRRCFP